MTGFEPQTSVVRSDCSTHWDATTAQTFELFKSCRIHSFFEFPPVQSQTDSLFLWRKRFEFQSRRCLCILCRCCCFCKLRHRSRPTDKQVFFMGCCHSSVDLSAPSILTVRVWVPSTPSTLLSICIWILSCGKDEIKQKEDGIGPLKTIILGYKGIQGEWLWLSW